MLLYAELEFKIFNSNNRQRIIIINSILAKKFNLLNEFKPKKLKKKILIYI